MSLIQRDFQGRRMVEIDTGARVLRLFPKPWSWPYGYRAYGCLFFGAGPFGAMVLYR